MAEARRPGAAVLGSQEEGESFPGSGSPRPPVAGQSWPPWNRLHSHCLPPGSETILSAQHNFLCPTRLGPRIWSHRVAQSQCAACSAALLRPLYPRNKSTGDVKFTLSARDSRGVVPDRECAHLHQPRCKHEGGWKGGVVNVLEKRGRTVGPDHIATYKPGTIFNPCHFWFLSRIINYSDTPFP